MSTLPLDRNEGVTPVPAAGGMSRRRDGHPSFTLFVVLNVLLLVRPQELFPRLQALHLYELTILACLALCWGRIVMMLRWQELRRNPITLCVLGLAPITTLACLWQSRQDMLEEYALEYVKIVLYYLVLVAVVDTPQRLKRMCLALGVLITVITAIAVLDFQGVIHVDSIKRLTDADLDPLTGNIIAIERLQGVGIFQDPNDLAHLLGVGVVLCVYGIERSRRLLLRGAWAAAMLLMLYGVYETKSRGGLLGLMAGLAVLFVARFGLRRAILVGAVTLPVLLVAFAGRQTNLSTIEGSAQTRVQLWSDALQALRDNPLFGIGPGLMYEQSGQVAHNSFLHAYAELGVPGGLLFFTAYWVAIWGVVQLRTRDVRVLDEDLARLTPVLAAALVGYSVGMLSLTRNYVIPTYLMLGMATVYLRLVETDPPKPKSRFGLRLLGKTFAWSVLFLLAVQLFVKASVRWGG